MNKEAPWSDLFEFVYWHKQCETLWNTLLLAYFHVLIRVAYENIL